MKFVVCLILSAIVYAGEVTAKAPDPATVDFNAYDVTCEEAEAIVNEKGSAKIGYKGIFDWYQVISVEVVDPCHYTEIADPVYLTTKDGVSCYMGYGIFCRPDPRYRVGN